MMKALDEDPNRMENSEMNVVVDDQLETHNLSRHSQLGQSYTFNTDSFVDEVSSVHRSDFSWLNQSFAATWTSAKVKNRRMKIGMS